MGCNTDIVLATDLTIVTYGGLVIKLCPTLATPWTVAHQDPLSMGFPRQEYWSRLSFASPGDLPDPIIKPESPALQIDSLLTELWGKPYSHLNRLEICFSLTQIKSGDRHCYESSRKSSETRFPYIFVHHPQKSQDNSWSSNHHIFIAGVNTRARDKAVSLEIPYISMTTSIYSCDWEIKFFS